MSKMTNSMLLQRIHLPISHHSKRIVFAGSLLVAVKTNEGFF